MPDRTEASRRAPSCVDVLLNRMDVLASVLDSGDELAVYAFDPVLDDLGLCPTLGRLDDIWERHTLDALLDDVQLALGAYRRQPELSRDWAAGRLRAVVAQARRQLDTSSPAVLEKALQSPRCTGCAYAAACERA